MSEYGWKRSLCSQKWKSCACCYGRNLCNYGFALFRSPSLFITLCHTHIYKLKSQQPLTLLTNDESHSATKCVNIDEKIQCANIYCLNTHRLPCLFISLLFDEVEVRSTVISCNLQMNTSSAWADESDWKQEAVFLVQRSQSSSFSHRVLVKWTEMVDMETDWTQA